MAENGKDIKVLEPDEAADPTSQAEALARVPGGALQRVQTPYTTAIAVQKPRNLDKVVAIVDREAQFAGEDFYYAWEANDRRKGRKVEISGPSYGCIVACARAYGNCVLPPVEAQEVEPGVILLNAGFCDLESGFTIYRSLRHHPTEPPGGFAKDADQTARWYDMQYQLAQSKVQRNAGKAGIPNWLVQRAVDKARDAVRQNISKDGIEQSVNKGLKLLSELITRPLDIIKNAVVSKWGKELSLATVEDVEALRTAYSAIRQAEDVEMMACTVFPLLAESTATGKPQTTAAPTVGDLGVGKPPVQPEAVIEPAKAEEPDPTPEPKMTQEEQDIFWGKADKLCGSHAKAVTAVHKACEDLVALRKLPPHCATGWMALDMPLGEIVLKHITPAKKGA